MRCPRCRRELADPAPAFCTQCGAPLRLRDEPTPRALRLPLAIDRRAPQRSGADDTSPGFAPPGRAAAAAPVAASGPSGDVAAVERSHWELGASPPRTGHVPASDTSDRIAADEAPSAAAPPDPDPVPLPDADSDVEVEAPEVHLRRPAPWRRAAADAIDVLPFVVGGIALARALIRTAARGLPAPATGLDGFLDLVARERVIVLSVAATVGLALGVYATLAHALAGATLGKRVLGLRLVGPDGARPSLARSAARSALVALSAGLLGLGVLLPFFTRSGRALHDLLARTWVVEAP